MRFLDFCASERGNVATLTGLAAAPLVVVMGLAFDVSRASTTEVHVSSALDYAVIAAAKDLSENKSVALAKATGERVFHENLNTLGITESCQTPVFDPDTAAQTISGTVVCDIPLTLSKLVGRESMPVEPIASAVYGSEQIEVALMLDVSGSMRGQRLTDLKSAANSLIDTLIPTSGSGPVRISLAPYATSVNAGTYGDVSTGITDLFAHTVANLGADPNALVAALTTAATSADTFDLVDAAGTGGLSSLSSGFFSCASAAPPPIAHAYPFLCEVAGSDGVGNDNCKQWSSGGQYLYSLPQSIFPIRTSTHLQMYYSDDDDDDDDDDDGGPDCEDGCRYALPQHITDYTYEDIHGSGASGSCIDGSGTATQIAADWQSLDWSAASETYTDYDFSILGATHQANISAKNQNCVTERMGTHAFTSVTPLAYPVGAESSACPSSAIEPLTHNTTILKDAITALHADGWTAGHLGIAWSWYTLAPEWNAVWPFNRRSQHGGPQTVKRYAILMTDGSFNTHYASGQGDSNAQARSLCTAMKADGVEIYSVAFNAPSDAQAVLSDCASSPSHFFIATSGVQLQSVYDTIAASLSQVRLIE